MNIKKIISTFAVTAIAAAIAISVPTAANASSTGGTGGGTGAGTVRAANWHAAAGTKGYAWRTFMTNAKKTGFNERTIEKMVSDRGANLNICKNATVIWWTGTGTGQWVYNWTGKTHGSGWTGAGSIEKPRFNYNRAPSTTEINEIKKWDSSGPKKMAARPGYTILCSYNDPPAMLATSGAVYKETRGGTPTTDNYSKKAVYSYSTSVAPMRLANGSWSAQSANVVKTDFGKFYDTVTNKMTSKQVETGANKAIAADAKKAVNNNVTLSDANQKNFANGGIVNVQEHTTYATVSARTVVNNSESRTCYVQTSARTWNQNTGKYNAATKKTICSAWTKVGGASSNTVNKSVQTAQNTGFWQMISAHCNEPEFTAMAKATGATVVNSGDASKNLSAVAHSKKYNAQPAKLDFGDPNHANADARKTGTTGFYDKECGFECVASKDTAQGASAANGAITNKGTAKQNGGTKNENRQGAVSGATNTNNMEFFRDNAPKKVTLDVWYPKTVGVVNYKSNPTAAITTTVSRWAQGTPSINGSGGGKFTMKAGSKTLFTGSDNAEAATQKNWHTNQFSNSNVTAMNGLARDFTVQGSWASEKNKPQVVNVKWEYAPNVSSTFPTQLGFSRTGTAASAIVKNANKAVAVPVQGKCYAHFGETVSKNTVSDFQKNTGTGTKNNLDGNLTNPSKDLNTNVVFNFVRSTTE